MKLYWKTTRAFDKSLAFNDHISNVINKCNKVNGMIRRYVIEFQPLYPTISAKF